MSGSLARILNRVVWFTAVFTSRIRCTGERVRIVGGAVLLALGDSMALIRPTGTARIGGVLEVRESLHPARKRATTSIAIYQTSEVVNVSATIPKNLPCALAGPSAVAILASER